MAQEEKKVEEPKITLELTPKDVFHLHLAVVSRTADATIKWANASSGEEQKYESELIAYLTGLSTKLQEVLSQYGKKQ